MSDLDDKKDALENQAQVSVDEVDEADSFMELKGRRRWFRGTMFQICVLSGKWTDQPQCH